MTAFTSYEVIHDECDYITAVAFVFLCSCLRIRNLKWLNARKEEAERRNIHP